MWVASTIASLALVNHCKGLAAVHDVTCDLVVGVERSKSRVALTQPTRKRSVGVDVGGEGGVVSGRRR